ncbi:hypothetical protein [Terriglobus aquaticus]|uniref:Uncharacterized protein n=1 Tax=Terriglobus aquaticus TaxID=940139 RepID=A0ABW9KL69_9BACT|nr:hypothetical protein [Terriglobus aquaticus]
MNRIFLPRLVLACVLAPLAASGATAFAAPGSHAKQQDAKADADGSKKDKDNDSPVTSSALKHPVLWQQRNNISSLDLLWGQGGQKHAPAPPFTFESEGKNGTNPKFDVTDTNGTHWRCKLGDEARPEVVASRLLWAVGYYVNDDYLLPEASIGNIHLKRGGNLVKDGRVEDVRFARKPGGQKKIGTWEWKKNPFYGSREFNGLRVMMAVMNNWDLKDENNSVYQDKKTGQQIFLVNDVGATFGSNGLVFSKAHAKGNVGNFKDSKFITRVNGDTVDFGTPKAPTSVLLLSAGTNAIYYGKRKALEWIGRDIPVADARWMGSQLSQISHQQLVDAFRAGNFPIEAIDEYVQVVESRIQELKGL